MGEFKRSQPQVVKNFGPNDPLTLSPDTLSFGQQKTILTALQFITCIGLVPCLDQGVGVPLEKRSGFGKILSEPQKIPEEDRYLRLLHIIRVLLDCAQQPSLGGLILSRHLGDLLAGLLQICHSPLMIIKQTRSENVKKSLTELDSGVQVNPHLSHNTEQVDAKNKSYKEHIHSNQPLFSSPADIGSHPATTDETGDSDICRSHPYERKGANAEDGCATDTEMAFCQAELDKLLKKTYQPMVIKELLLLQGGPGGGKKTLSAGSSKNRLPRAPAWLTKICGHLLSERFRQPKGVHNVVKVVLDTGGRYVRNYMIMFL